MMPLMNMCCVTGKPKNLFTNNPTCSIYVPVAADHGDRLIDIVNVFGVGLNAFVRQRVAGCAGIQEFDDDPHK
jgi:hypothetical protein